MHRKQSEQSKAVKDAALIRKTQPEPTAAIRTPARARPINLAALNDVEFRATAFGKSVSLTVDFYSAREVSRR